MSYVPTEWKTGDVITAERLNKAEQGIKDVHDNVADISSEISTEVASWLDEHVNITEGVNIDDTLSVAGSAADAKATGDEINDLKSSINQAPEIKDSEKTGVDLDVSDPNGNVILRLADGHIKTKNFDSADIDADIFADSSKTGIDLDVADGSGYVVARFADGHVKTKNFDSEAALENLAGKIGQNQGAANAGKVLTVGQDGLVAPAEPTAPDSKPAVETFSTTVEFKTGTAMNVAIDEKFNRGDKVLFHVEDGYKNYESGALATYYENSTTLAALRRGSNGYFEHIVTADNSTLSIRIPASGYDNDRTVTLYVYRINGEVKPKIVTVAADGTGMYTTIRGAIDSITDANSYTNPYEIWVYPGTYDVLADYTDEEIAAVENPYTQTSFVGPKLTDGVSIKGIGNREDVVLTATLDPNVWGSDVRGQVSTLNTQGSGSMENLTILAYNIRYCVHDDFRNPSNQKTWRVLRNLTFGGSLTNTTKYTTYGAGMATPRDYLIEDCDFVYTLGIHGNTNYSFPCHIKVNRCSGYAFFIGDYADEDTDAVIDVEVNDCNFERMYIVAHTPGLTKPHVRLYGVGNEQTMVVCSSLYHYVFGNIVTIEPGFDPGTVVAHTASTDMFEATSNWDIATGVVVSADSEHSYVQREGFITAEMIGLTGLTAGDYVTIDQTTHKVTGGGTAADAIGVVVWIESHGYTAIKLRGGF